MSGGEEVHLVIGAGELCGRYTAAALELEPGVIVRRSGLEGWEPELAGVGVIHMCAETWAPTLRLEFRDQPSNPIRRLAEAAIGAGVRRWVHLSSATVYGPDQRVRLVESAPLQPLHPYERLKLAEEQWMRARGKLLEVVVIRAAWPFGSGEPVLAALLEGLRVGGLWLPEGGRSSRTFVAGADLGRAFVAAARRGRAGGVYLVASFDSSWRQLLEAVAAEAGAGGLIRSYPYDLGYLRESVRELYSRVGMPCWPGRFGLDLLAKTHLYEDGWSRRELIWSPRTGSPSEAIAEAAQALRAGDQIS